MRFEMTREQFDAKVSELKAKGVDVPGDGGQLTHNGVTLKYAYDGKALEVDVLHHPFLVSEGYVETQLTAWFAGA